MTGKIFLSVMLVSVSAGFSTAATAAAPINEGGSKTEQTATVPAKAYVIAEIDVKNLEGYRDYVAAAFPVIQQYGGRFLVRGGSAIAVEGRPPAQRVMVIEFESLEQAKKFEYSKEYTAIAQLRRRTSDSRLMIVEGTSDVIRDQP